MGWGGGFILQLQHTYPIKLACLSISKTWLPHWTKLLQMQISYKYSDWSIKTSKTELLIFIESRILSNISLIFLNMVQWLDLIYYKNSLVSKLTVVDSEILMLPQYSSLSVYYLFRSVQKKLFLLWLMICSTMWNQNIEELWNNWNQMNWNQ